MNSKSVLAVLKTMLLFSIIVGATFHIFFVVAEPNVIKVPYDQKTIQKAINAASPGDTIFVYNGTYFENVVVNKSVTLTGENSRTTIIDGNNLRIVVEVTVSQVQISGFTIRNGGSYTGIWVELRPGGSLTSVTIKNNILINNYLGVQLVRCSSCTINANTMQQNQLGIRVTSSTFNDIIGNTINSSLYYGIHLNAHSDSNTIKFNNLINNRYGVHLEWSNLNFVYLNKLYSTVANGYGIRLTSSSKNDVIGNTIKQNYRGAILWTISTGNHFYYNNFIDNTEQVYHYNTSLTSNTWDTDITPGTAGNYWSDYKGVDDGTGKGRWNEPRVKGDGIGDTLIPHLGVDWYPLMHPWTPTPSPWPQAFFTYSPTLPTVNETVTFDATASYDYDGYITSYMWDFDGDNATDIVETVPITHHAYEEVGNYTVTLTVVDNDGLSNSTSKILTVVPARLIIDLYSQRDGKGPNQPSDAFAPQEEIELTANVTYNDQPVEGKLVAFEVLDPVGSVMFRTNQTTSIGIATTSFRIPASPIFGTWIAIATVEVAGRVAKDTMPFKVGWIIEILSIETVDQFGAPKTDFKKGEHLYINVIVQNIAFVSKNVTLTIVAQDECLEPIGTAGIQLKVDPGLHKFSFLFDLIIPSWSLVGSAMAYGGALTNWTWENGIPYCPEAPASFIISHG